MPDLNWNKVVWDTTYGWHDGGEEWSTAWGGSEAQWYGSIFPRLHRFFPPRRILEIAPGFGRWTKFLIPVCDEFVGIEWKSGGGAACRLAPQVDIIVTAVTNDTLAAKNATNGIPIVMAAAGDPVATGIVSSLARPGGNITGLSQMNPELTGKRLELLKEIAPNVSSVAVLVNPDDPISALGLNEIELPARKSRESKFIRWKCGTAATWIRRSKRRSSRAQTLSPSCQIRYL